MLSIYMAVDVFSSDGFFAKEMRQYVDFFKSAKPVAPDGEVLVPGEPERALRKKRLAEGIPLPDDAWRAIIGAAHEVGLGQSEIEEAIA